MLRGALLVVSGLVLLVTLAISWESNGNLWAPGILAGMVFLGVVLENFRYKRLLRNAPGEGWQATGEKFVDPESGDTVTVFFKPDTGERTYVSRRK